MEKVPNRITLLFISGAYYSLNEYYAKLCNYDKNDKTSNYCHRFMLGCLLVCIFPLSKSFFSVDS